MLLIAGRLAAGRQLIIAAELGDNSQVERLLKSGAFPNMRNRSGYTALWLAASNGNAKAIQILIQYGADPNRRSADGTTPLMEAARMGRVESVAALLRGGAKVELEGNNGETAQGLAEREKHRDVVKLLQAAVANRQ
jgi:ankyrin repeat protein